MKRSTLSLAVIFVLSTLIVAQDATPPPPAPAKPRAVDTVSIRSKWESVEGAYKVAFPGKPTTTSSVFQSAFGPSNIYTTAVGTGLGHYTVVYFDFPTAITNKYDLDMRFTMMRDNQAKNLKARVMLDTEFMFGSHYGRANTYEFASGTASTRAVLVGPRMYLIQIITPGKISSMSAGVAAATKTRVDKFLDSFEVTKVLEAKTTEVALPDSFGVTATDASFRSSFFGISLTPPAGWKLSNQEDSELLMELGKDEIRKSDQRLAEHLTDENARVLAIYANTDLAKETPEAFIFLIAEKASFPNFRAEAVAKTYISLYLEKTEKVTQPPTVTKVGGREAAWIETFDSESGSHQRVYFLNLKGIAFQIALSYSKAERLPAMLKVVESVKFDEQ